jgi:peroxiredoxin
VEVYEALAGRNDVAVVAVLPAEPAELRRFGEELGLGGTLLADPSWSTYRTYGLRRGGRRDVWLSPPTWLAYARLVVRGGRPHVPRQDVYELGGDFLVDREGRIAWAYRSSHPADRPPAAEILRQVDAL